MNDKLLFNEVKKKNIQILKQYVPIVARVHGANHEEFYEVRDIFDSIINKIKDNSIESPDLEDEFKKLREITDNYTIPGDVCESYEAVYTMLAELDKAFELK